MKEKYLAFIEKIKPANDSQASFLESAIAAFKIVCFEGSHMIYHSDGDKFNKKVVSNVSVENKDDNNKEEIVNDLMRQWVRSLSSDKFGRNFHREHIEHVLLSENPMVIIGDENGDKVSIKDNQMFGMIKDRVREMVNDPQNAFIKNSIVSKLKSLIFSARKSGQPQKAAYYTDQITKLDPNIKIEMKDIEGKVKEQEQAKKDAMVDMKDIADIVAKKGDDGKGDSSESPSMKNIADIVAGKLAGDDKDRKSRIAELDKLFM